jgi:beta-lactamase family protein
MKHAPSHAGRLPPWERLVFALVFALMAAFVVSVTVSAAGKGRPPAPGSTSPSVSSATGRLQPVADGGAGSDQRGPGSRRTPLERLLSRRLARALRSLVRADSGHLAVGVLDVSTGARAIFDGDVHVHTASIEKVDILAALLLDHQQAGTAISEQEAALAVPMIESSDDDAATDLYSAVGGAAGLAAANARLGLSHTIIGPAGYWGLTSTTVGDQLRLLADLTARKSPLSTASQDYELGLMASVITAQRWGISAAASPGTSYAIKDGWLPDPALWVTNSIGVVEHAGQRLLIAVLANGQPTEAAGVALDAAAAADAVRVVTRQA